jgi:Ca-activated chloride channel family protein
VTAAYAVSLVIAILVLRPGCVQLVVWASQEKSDLLGRIADRYELTRPSEDLRCVDIKVVKKASGEAEQALANEVFESNEARPDVWSPAASTWVDLLEQHRTVGGVPTFVSPERSTSIVQSPLVIAMLEPMATALGWPAKQISLLEIFGLAQDAQGWASRDHPEWKSFKLGKTNPFISTSGLHALIATYRMAGSGSIDDPTVRAYMKGVESSVVHYGSTVSGFLKNLAEADDRGEALSYVSAIAMEEYQVWQYDDGNPDFRFDGKRLAPTIPLVAIYPREGTLVADHPYVVLDAPWVGSQKKRAAAKFLAHLKSDAIQAEFKAAGFRGARGETGPVIDTSPWLKGFNPNTQLTRPDPAKLDAIQASWRDYRKKARVLFVVDVSASMGDRLGSASANKLDLAKQALSLALREFADDDQVGLWTLAGKDRRELLGVGSVRDQKAQLRSEIDRLTPEGAGRALYATVSAAVATMHQPFDRDRINAVILLTDGRNDDLENTTLNGLIRSLRAQPEDERVRVFTIAYGAGADSDALNNIALASLGVRYDAADSSVIGRAVLEAVSNF